ncbi:MAG TPA: toll/interleukin-1 receptor domain-containing protein [Steroidobacteraceae bacterium]|nr:toll/interleukin-1 receptor domain-containing protein [Steroidobacteraceae bacterium]
MPGEVFVSYSQPDRDCALELVAQVEAQGISCWVAPRDVSPSADWAAEIIDAISNAQVMVLVFSAQSNDSPQVRREVERAVHKRLRILPFRIEDVLPSKSLEYFLSAQHWLDAFPPPRESHYAKLCTHLRVTLSRGAPERPSSPDGTSGPARADAHERTPAPLQPALIHEIEAELSTYIGPVARVLVKRAVARATTAEELLAQLAADLDSHGEQQRFTERCRQLINRG